MANHDEIIKEVRAIREAYAERFDFDIQALFRDAKERQKQGGRKIVAFEPKRVEFAGAGRPIKPGEQKKPR